MNSVIELRNALGFTQQQLAAMLGVSLSTLSRWERNQFAAHGISSNIPEYTLLQRRAGAAVSSAIQSGELASPTSQNCADCGSKAIEYDHRDYFEALEVDAVCRHCNRKRGPALMTLYRLLSGETIENPEQKITTKNLTFNLSLDAYNALQRHAEADHRTLSNLVSVILENWLKQIDRIRKEQGK